MRISDIKNKKIKDFVRELTRSQKREWDKHVKNCTVCEMSALNRFGNLDDYRTFDPGFFFHFKINT